MACALKLCTAWLAIACSVAQAGVRGLADVEEMPLTAALEGDLWQPFELMPATPAPTPIWTGVAPASYVVSGEDYDPPPAPEAKPEAEFDPADLPAPDAPDEPQFKLPELETQAASQEEKKEKAWYEKMKIRGYAQFRYNRIGETNPNLRSPQGDRSIGDDQSFLLRRARMVFSGDAGEYVSYYIQPDFASGATGPNPLHFLQIRDFYADVHLDPCKEHRLRIGQSKVPYGFENLQSSQNRLALDRNDPLNSAVVNERDLGVFYYWAPTFIRERFKHLVESGLKGSGDYGVVGLGIYNGQTANRPELNSNQHVVARISYPFMFANGQIFEPGLSGYTGTYTIERSAGIGGGPDFLDRRGAVSFVLYPQPWGVQGEWTNGQGPQLNAAQTDVERSSLYGGYFQLFYKWDEFCVFGRPGTLFPFVRLQRYDGGRKHEANSPTQRIREAEVGFEYQFSKALELTAQYTFAERTFPQAPYQQEEGSLLRLQLQWNY